MVNEQIKSYANNDISCSIRYCLYYVVLDSYMVRFLFDNTNICVINLGLKLYTQFLNKIVKYYLYFQKVFPIIDSITDRKHYIQLDIVRNTYRSYRKQNTFQVFLLKDNDRLAIQFRLKINIHKQLPVYFWYSNIVFRLLEQGYRVVATRLKSSLQNRSFMVVITNSWLVAVYPSAP